MLVSVLYKLAFYLLTYLLILAVEVNVVLISQSHVDCSFSYLHFLLIF